jgi:hypothetical protein
VDCREVNVGVIDAVEHVGKDGGRKGEADIHQLRVGVAGGLYRGEVFVADGAARLCKLADKADQGIALGIDGWVAIADVFEFVRLQSRELAEQAVRSHTVVAAGNTADGQLDGFLVAPAQRARREHGVGRKYGLQRSGSMGADGGKGVRYVAIAFLISA